MTASVKNYVSDLESMNFIKPILHIFYLGQEERLDKGVDTGLRPVLRLNLLKNQAPSATKKIIENVMIISNGLINSVRGTLILEKLEILTNCLL